MTDTHALCGTSALQNNRIYNLTFADRHIHCTLSNIAILKKNSQTISACYIYSLTLRSMNFLTEQHCFLEENNILITVLMYILANNKQDIKFSKCQNRQFVSQNNSKSMYIEITCTGSLRLPEFSFL